jgi:hypothetical protein
MFREPTSGKTGLEKIWEYQCTPDGINRRKQLSVPQKDLNGRLLQAHHTSGGNVIEMPDNSLFVSMSGPYCKVFIVSQDKEILWSALPEKRNPVEKEWNPVSEYRASIITREQLENVIWNSERTK